MTKRRRVTGEFKAKVALEALRGECPIQAEEDQKTAWEAVFPTKAARYGVHPNQVSVANSKASRPRQGPRRRMTSLLNNPITLSASALSSPGLFTGDRFQTGGRGLSGWNRV